MPSFEDLPNEIILMISQQLRSTGDVLTLSRTIKWLHSLLRSEVQLCRKHRRLRLKKVEDLQQCFDMLMSILHHPRLGHYVHHMEIDRVHPEQEAWQSGDRFLEWLLAPRQRKISAKDLLLLEKLVNDVDFEVCLGARELSMCFLIMAAPSAEVRVSERLFSTEDADRAYSIHVRLAVLLMAVCPNLKSLAIADKDADIMRRLPLGDGFSDNEDEDCDECSDNNNNENGDEDKDAPSYLQKLERIQMLAPHNGGDSSREYQGIETLAAMDTFAAIPSLRCWSMAGVFALDQRLETSVEYGSLSVTKIDFQHCLMSSDHLGEAIMACRELEELRFSVGGRVHHETITDMALDAKTILLAVCLRGETLQVLDLDIDDELSETSESDADLPPYTSGPFYLSHLKELKSLSIGIHALMLMAEGVSVEIPPETQSFKLGDRMPMSLESLCIRGYVKGADAQHDVQIDDLIMWKSRYLPHLNQVSGIEQLIPSAVSLAHGDVTGQVWEEVPTDWSDWNSSMGFERVRHG